MNIFKTLAIFATTALVFTSTYAWAETLKVAVAAEPYAPMYYPDASGEWHGFEIDLAGALCKAAELDCKITPVAWDGIIPALTSGKIDMIMASLSITPEREKIIAFSDRYYLMPPLLIGAKDIKMEATPESLAGKLIGTQVSTSHERYIQEHFVPAGATIKSYQTVDEANNDLAAGRIDAVMMDAASMRDFLKTDSGKACCEAKGVPAPDDNILGLGVGVGLRKEDNDLRLKMNAAIKKVHDSGEYDAIAKPYFDFDIWGK